MTSITNIIGEAKVGETLTAGSVIPNEATVTYAWLRIGPKMPEWEYIPGATTNKYTIAASDVGYQIRVAATGTGNYSGTVVSKGTTKVTTNVIVKEDLRVEGISARPINLGQKLVESELNVIVKNSKNETINGILNWDEPTRVLTKDESCAWTFIPTDLELYNIIQRKLTVGVISPNDFDGGDGTASRPYRVSTAEQLNNVRKYLDKHFIQTTDITLDITVWKDREGWEPIGTKDAPFTGSYDGLGYKIKELTIYGDHYYQGLFGEIGSTGQIINIALLDVKINGADYLGSLASINRGLIENCYATGSIQGWSTVGGLVGFNRGTIKRSYSTVSLKGLYQYSRFYGGLAGESTGAIEDSYATGRVVAYNNVGGLVGDNMGTLNRCYAKGYVEATTTDTSGYLHRDHGGIVGYRWDGSKVIDCYYDKETTHRSDDNGKGYPKSTKEMTESKTFKNWDSTIWTIDESVSYPYLLWQGKTNIPLKWQSNK